MPTPFSPEFLPWIVAGMAILCMFICATLLLAEHRAAARVYRMCDKLLEANRVLSLTIAHPLAAARLEQKRQATEDAQQRKAALSKILSGRGEQRQTRFQQDRAANVPVAPPPRALRYVPLVDADVVPPKERPRPEEPKA
jgi:hypothetical protein